MNDGVFASYENFLCMPSVSFQPSELATSLHTLDHEYPPSSHYFSSKVPADDHAQQQLTNAMPVMAGAASSAVGGAGSATNSASAKNASNRDAFAASMPSIPSIPFVQIHTTNARPQRSSFGNVFRRSTASHEEIKSEPIKSESADAAKERVNATPTPPQSGSHVVTPSAVPTSTPISRSTAPTADTTPLTNEMNISEISAVAEVAGARRSLPTLHKCQQCPFISLSESALDAHDSSTHSDNGSELPRERLMCPGCTNVFYVLNALETHLRADHLMTADDARQLLQALSGEGTTADDSRHQQEVETSDTVAAIATPQNEHPQQRSRIYLKNVECLREPRRAPLEQQQLQIGESVFYPPLGAFTDCGGASGSLAMDVGGSAGGIDFLGMLEDVTNGAIDQNGNNCLSNNNNNNNNNDSNSSNSCNNSNNNIMMSVVCSDSPEPDSMAAQSLALAPPKKQKISIKSVDVLREPALLRRDYDMQNNNFNNFMSACSELELDGGTSQQQYGCSYGSTAAVVGTLSAGVSAGESVATSLNFEKPRRRPKIYIKNVDILKEPHVLSGSLGAASLTVPSYGYMQQTLPSGEDDFMSGSGGGNENGADSLSGSSTAYDSGGGLASLSLPINNNGLSEQYLFENSGVGYMPTIGGDHDGFSFVNAASGGGGVGNFLETAPLITEPTPPPLPLAPTVSLNMPPNVAPTSPSPLPSLSLSCPPLPEQRQKIFIKNVDILKQPQFQEQRGTLHLRTVDELNLMNKNEVENLIAPNLDNMQMAVGSADLADELGEEALAAAKLDTEDDTLFDAAGHFKLHDFDSSVANTWNDDYDLGEDIDCIITATIAPISAAAGPQPVSLPTTSTAKIQMEPEAAPVSLISIRDIDELTGTHNSHQQQHQHRAQPEPDDQLEREEPPNTIPDLTSHLTTPLQTMLPLEPIEVLQDKDIEMPIEFPSCRSSPLSPPPPSTKQKRPTVAQKGPALAAAAKPREAAVDSTAMHFGSMPPLVPMTHLTVAPTAGDSSIPAAVAACATVRDVVAVSGRIPLPPLVPVSPQIHLLAPAVVATSTTASSTAAPPPTAVTTGRIYVASNLMQASSDKGPTVLPQPKLQTVPRPQAPVTSPRSQAARTQTVSQLQPPFRLQPPPQTQPASRPPPAPQSQPGLESLVGQESQLLTEIPTSRGSQSPRQAQTSAAVSVTGGTSVRGRPFGSNRTGITKMRKLQGPATDHEAGAKCAVQGCAFRFKRPETLAYHQRCHGASAASSQSIHCPECRSMDFTNWNTLHTHLWRSHQIDMELYSCELCAFKTPVYSRLINTHSKIHFDARNYKCDQCAKAFKNTKQLKNHRRWHRNHAMTAGASTDAASDAGGSATMGDAMPVLPPELHRCNECDAVFSHQKTLREHLAKHGAAPAQCDVCGRCFSSRSSLRLHMLTHMEAKRFKCDTCAYTANDHNAFRRHKMTHENAKTYACPHCTYKSIQSKAFQKHVQLKHPEVADSIVHKCSRCPFATINRMLFAVHQAKHEATNSCRRQTPAAPTPAETVAPALIDSTFSVAPQTNALVVIVSAEQQGQQTTSRAPPEQAKKKIQVKRGLVRTDTAISFSLDNHAIA